jgi:hypothetical protein
MHTIQVILIGAVVVTIGQLLLSRKRMRVQAGLKLGLVALGLLAIYAVLRPDDLTLVANKVGVGRGADLLLYALVVAFGISTVTTYARFREQEVRYARLVRIIALAEAEARTAEPETDQPPGDT